MPQRSRRRVFGAIGVLVATMAWAPAAAAAPPSQLICEARNNDNVNKLLECVTLEGVREHQAAFQAIADENGGTRAAGTPGYAESVDYVVEKMTAAGYNVTRDEFPFVYIAPATLEQTAPIEAVYETGTFTGSGFGVVDADVTPIDINLGPGQANSSGCEGAYTQAGFDTFAPIVPDPAGPDDFAGLVAGDIALIQRGTCGFALKATNAEAAGASAVIIFNQGNTPERSGLIIGNAVAPEPLPFALTIPVVGASFADGSALAQAGSTAHVEVPVPQNIILENVIAESKSGNPNNVVMAGAHLDSVPAGPGINDNGSGSAAILETAEQMAKVKPRNQVRFAWWGAEEANLVGSTAYVNGLSQAEKDKIALYLNFDMVGSPNYVFFIYDGDNSDGVGSPAGPPGSAQIEKTFERYFDSVDEPFKGTDFSGRSDYGPFIAAGIPSGGLFTGAEGIKTAEEAAIWGGTAGQQYDPCYHLACDTYANNNDHALNVNSDAVAYSTLQYAMSTSDINGLRGKGNFKLPPSQPAE
jgi:Zn-dependent M28 family amino/carboxypeptidase